MMQASKTQIVGLSDAELDALPLGVIRLDPDGTILFYNAAEALLARRTASATTGLNFFSDVAPCTDVKDFHGRFRTFAARSGAGMESFAFVFRFGWENRRVAITMVKRPADTNDPNIYILVDMAVQPNVARKR